MPIHEFEKDIEPFLGRQASIELVVGLFGVLKTAEYLNGSRHALDFTTLTATSPRPFGGASFRDPRGNPAGRAIAPRPATPNTSFLAVDSIDASAPHILIKFSDVFQTAPDPAAYFREVQRSVGDIPLNIFATVNGYFATPDAGIEAQPALARELLSPIVRDMVGRFRLTRAGKDSVIFTRPSGLLNLKVLLAVPREDHDYIPTTVGMLALHANDYTDISLPDADPEVFARDLQAA